MNLQRLQNFATQDFEWQKSQIRFACLLGAIFSFFLLARHRVFSAQIEKVVLHLNFDVLEQVVGASGTVGEVGEAHAAVVRVQHERVLVAALEQQAIIEVHQIHSVDQVLDFLRLDGLCVVDHAGHKPAVVPNAVAFLGLVSLAAANLFFMFCNSLIWSHLRIESIA